MELCWVGYFKNAWILFHVCDTIGKWVDCWSAWLMLSALWCERKLHLSGLKRDSLIMLNYRNDDGLNRKSEMVEHTLCNVFVFERKRFQHHVLSQMAPRTEALKCSLNCEFSSANQSLFVPIFRAIYSSVHQMWHWNVHIIRKQTHIHVRRSVSVCVWRLAIITKLLSYLLTVTHTQTPIKINFYYISLMFSVLALFRRQNIRWRMRLFHELYMHVHWLLACMGCKCKYKCKCTRYYMNMCLSRDHSRAHTAHTHYILMC